jgi:hypothetical protein
MKICMRQLIKIFFAMVGLAFGLQSAWGYSFLGPNGNGGDAWQSPVIGYDLAYIATEFEFGGPVFLGDIGGPKNIGEGYRRNVPVLYYAYNANFLDFFGSNGPVAVDGAFAIMDSLTNVDSYSTLLTEFPLQSQSFNYEAQALGLTDLKSETLHLLVEQLGLDQPERFTWTLHERDPGTACPATTTYLVVQRNFDFISSPQNQTQYSPYVNDTLYSYFIIEDCTGPNPLAITQPFSVDPLADQYTAVAADVTDGLQIGGFYTGLTRDDVAGLRSLYSTNNLARETAAPNLLSTNVAASVILTTQPFGPLLAAQTDDPGTLQALFPGLIIANSTSNLSLTVTTNVTYFYTNQPGPDVTNFAPAQVLVTSDLSLLLAQAATNDPVTLEALYPGLLVSTVTNGLGVVTTTNITAYYTNAPGPDVTNYDTQNPFPISTMDLNLFWLQALTNTAPTAALAIAQLQALYPGLVIVSANPYFTNVVTTNYVTYLTNQLGNGTPYPGPVVAVTAISSIVTNFQARYTYTFGNVMININGAFYPFTSFTASAGLFANNQTTTVQNFVVTNLIGAPYGSAPVTNITTTTVQTHTPSGNFFIIPTNWCGYTLAPIPPNPSPLTQTFVSYTNTVSTVTTNSVGTTGTNTALGVAAATQITTSSYQNFLEVVDPGVCEPVLAFATNVTTTVANTGYQNTLLNIVTNTYSSNSLEILVTTNIFATNGAPVGTLVTNVTNPNFTNSLVNVQSGDFFIVPTNWCGYTKTSLLTNVVASTNTFLLTTNNVQFSRTTVTYFTNHTLLIQPGVCEPVLQSVTNYTTNVVTVFQNTFANVYTNFYSPTSSVVVLTTNIFTTNGAQSGILLTNGTSVTNFVSVPTGDYFFIPTNWCNFSITATLFTNVVFTTNTVTATATNGDQFSQATISSFTNHTFQIQPDTCTSQAGTTGLRQGIERVQFVRANFDSLLGQFFQPITNYYTMTGVTNSQLVTQYFQRVVTAPDILFTAADLAAGAAGVPFNGSVERTTPNYDVGNVLPGLAGPGVINSPSTFTYNKVGNVYGNGATEDFSPSQLFDAAFLDELTQVKLLTWASFDSSTNDPVVYPDGTSIANLENQVLVQISPTSLADGNNGVSYGPVTFTATGGSFTPPFTWSATGLPTNMTMSSGGTLAGVPNTVGTFDFTVQLTDSNSRTVQWNYSITIDP